MIRSKNTYVGRKLRITEVWTKGRLYSNLTPGSHHRVIKAPGITPNSPKGVWVMGNKEPAYIDKTEFEFLTLKRTK
jgi:hypothetical protein